MRVGIVCEFNPLHLGHQHLLSQVRGAGADTIVCAMSGNFVQRGEAALLNKHIRAAAAVNCGADLVLELPTPWAMATAETFARGGVALLQKAGCDHIAFGSEWGDAELLQSVAEAVDSAAVQEKLRENLEKGITFAAARQQAVAQLLGEEAAQVLARPNDTLAVEYLRASRALEANLSPIAIPRVGAGHDEGARGGIASASFVRALVREGKIGEACGYLPEVMGQSLREAVVGGEIADTARCEGAILAFLRGCEARDLAPYDGGGEGLYRRLYEASRQGRSVEEVLALAKTKRYTAARLRRMVMAAWLGVTAETDTPPYGRVLAANEAGRHLLREMRDAGAPVLTKAADVAALGSGAEKLLRREAKWTDLYGLCCENVPPCGEEYRKTPYMM